MQTHVMARLPLYPVLFCRYSSNSSSQKYHLIGPPDPESNLVILKLRPPRNEAVSFYDMPQNLKLTPFSLF